MTFSNRWLSPLVLSALTTVGVAHAHISLDQAGTHKSRYGDADIKKGPCGKEGGTRGENVYTYTGGETIPVEVREFISHPGYFRIAFDADGDDDFLDPQTIAPPYRDCMDDPADKCGADDFYNNAAVLPEMDDLDVHNYDAAKTYSWDVKLPNVSCDNCTLQIIQVMEDPPPIHAPFTPGTEDIYYQCIDLVLEKSAAQTGDDAGAGAKKSDDGGCTIARGHSTPGAGLGVLLAAGAVLGLRRRARSVRRA